MAVRIPVYERHVQLDAAAQTVPRYHGDSSIAMGLKSASGALTQLGAHYAKKQDQFDNQQLSIRLAQADQQVQQIIAEETQRYNPNTDRPGELYNRIQARVGPIYQGVLASTPPSLQPKAQEHIVRYGGNYSNKVAQQETQIINGNATAQLDAIKGRLTAAVKDNPDFARDAIKEMRASVEQMKGSFSDSQRKSLSKNYEDGIADTAVNAYNTNKRFGEAKDFANEYATERADRYPDTRVPGPSSSVMTPGEQGGEPVTPGSAQAPVRAAAQHNSGADYLRAERAPLINELAGDPQLKLRLAAVVAREHESDATAVVESLFNRTTALNKEREDRGLPPMSLRDMIYGKGGTGAKSFYGPVRAGLIEPTVRQLERQPARLEKIMTGIDAAGESNLLKGATDQGSGNDPNVNHPGGKIVRGGETYNDWGGGYGHAANAKFRTAQQAAIADAESRKGQPVQPTMANVVDEEGNKVVVDPATGQMTTQDKLTAKQSQVAGPGAPSGDQPQATIPLPRARPPTEAGSWLTSTLARIDGAAMKSNSIASAMKRSLTATLNSDLSSRLNTGTPVKLSKDLQNYYGTEELSYDFISNKLGEGEAIKWQQGVDRAAKFYNAGANMSEMSEEQIVERLRALQPVPGSPDFAEQQEVFTHAIKEKNRILTDREKDPAAAANQMPAVKAAYEAYLKNPNTETGQKLMSERMKAQEYLGIDEAVRTPLTNSEAARLAKPMANKGQLDPAGAAAATIERLRQMVGDDEEVLKAGLSSILKAGKLNQDSAVLLSTALSDAQKRPAAGASPSTLPTAKTGAAPNLLPTEPIAYDDYGNPILKSEPPPDNYADVDRGLFKPETSVIPGDRVKRLLADPHGETERFDSDFGSGATAHFIQKQHELGLKSPVAEPWISPDQQTPVSPDQSLEPATPDEEQPPPKLPDEEDSTGGP